VDEPLPAVLAALDVDVLALAAAGMVAAVVVRLREVMVVITLL